MKTLIWLLLVADASSMERHFTKKPPNKRQQDRAVDQDEALQRSLEEAGKRPKRPAADYSSIAAVVPEPPQAARALNVPTVAELAASHTTQHAFYLGACDPPQAHGSTLPAFLRATETVASPAPSLITSADPSKPFPMGDSIEILFLARSASLGATKV